jgi:DNA-binding PadR family transcriptional regulator
MRRKPGTLVPLEIDILETVLDFTRGGVTELHGFQLARSLQDHRESRRLTAYGTLYRALERLEAMGFLARRWEDPQIAAAEGRPRRRFYRLTVDGERVAAEPRPESARSGLRRTAAAVQS